MNPRAERDLQHARECAEIARRSADPHLQRTCLDLEKQWLSLAKSAEQGSVRSGIKAWHIALGKALTQGGQTLTST